jgi:hypothetical protein
MGTLHHANDPAFVAALAGVRREFDQNLVAVHGLADIKGRNEDVSLKALANLTIQRAHESEAVAMHSEYPDHKIAIHSS